MPQSMDSVLLKSSCSNKCYIIFTWQPPDNSAATNVSHYLFYLNDNLVSAEVLVLDETGTNQTSFTEANCTNQTVGISASNGCFEGPRTFMMVSPRNLTVQDVQRIPNTTEFLLLNQDVADLLMEECGSELPNLNGGMTNTQCKLNSN